MNVNDFKGSFKNLARPTLYKVYGFGASSQLEFLCKAAQLPGGTMGVIEVPFMGRKIKLAGDRTYLEWTPTIYNDETFALRTYFEEWLNKINLPEANVGVANVEDYKEDGYIDQLAVDGSVIATYKMIGCWPSEVTAIDVSFESNDTIEEFNVTMQMDYWERQV